MDLHNIVPEPKLVLLDSQPHSSDRSIEDFREVRIEEYFRSTELTANSQRAYRRSLIRFTKWTDKAWHSLKHQDLDCYKEYLKQLGLKNATICQELAALKSFFNWLTIKDYISKDPTLTLIKPKIEPPTPQELSDEEGNALYLAIEQKSRYNHRDRALLKVLEHGLRASEVTALNINDYDGKRLQITKAKMDSVGFVPLLSSASEAINAYLKWREVEMELKPDFPLFVSHSNRSKGKRLTYNGLYSLFDKYAKIAQIKDFHLHRLRHTLATNLALKGMDSMLARRITRHKSEASYQRYSQRGLDRQAEEQFWQLFDTDGK